MRDAPSLLVLTPPRRSRMTLAAQVEMLAALTQARPATGQGVALEIVGADGHASFLARAATPAARDQLAMFLSGYYPQGSITILQSVDDPARLRVGESAVACELRLSRGNALPLRLIRDDEDSSQMLRVIGVLRGLAPGTRALCQVILWPAPRRWSRAMEAWLRQEREHPAQRPAEGGGPPAALVLGGGLALLAGLTGYRYYHAHDLLHLAGLAGEVIGCGALFLAHATIWAPDPPPEPRLVERKLAAPACTARLRLLVAGGTAEGCRRGMDALLAAYGAYQEPRGNGFVARACSPVDLREITTAGAPRFWLRPWPLLSAEEVAHLWHLPGDGVDVPGLARGGSVALLPTASALKSGIPIGTATLGAHSETVCLPHAAYRANVAVIGATGAGKSTFLQHLAHDAVTRDGVQLVVIDPDSDLVAAMVGRLPDEEKLRAVAVSFGHPERAIGVNLLDAATGRRHDQIVSSIVEAWKRFYDEAWGPRLEDLIRAACTTILKANQTRPRHRQLTLLDIKPLLQVSSFRRQVMAEADDIKLTTYWRDDYMGMPRTERLTAIKPVLTRINRFLQHDAAHAIVGQSASTIDLPRLLESGAPLFIDAAAQTIGKETAALLDAVLINIINDAVCERRSYERQVLIIVDEFQHAPGLWDEYLPRIRKRHGSYVLTSQGLATIDAVRPDLHKVLIGNTGTQVIFRTLDPEEATYLAGVLENTVTPEDLQTLKLRQCYIKTSDGSGPVPVVSATLPPPPPSSSGTTRLIAEACAHRYGRPISEVMAARNRWMTELFFAPPDERGHNLVRADDGDAPVDGHSTATAATTEQSPSATLGSQPLLGLPVTRTSPSERTTARPPGRRSASPVPSPPSSPVLSTALPMDMDVAGADPLPLPPVTADQRQQPQGRGTARRRRARRRATGVLPLPGTTGPSEAAGALELEDE